MPFKGDPLPAPDWLGPLGQAWDHGTAGMRRMLRSSKTARRITPDRRLNMAYEAFDLFTEDGVRLNAWWVEPEASARRSDGLVATSASGTQKPNWRLCWRPRAESFHRPSTDSPTSFIRSSSVFRSGALALRL